MPPEHTSNITKHDKALLAVLNDLNTIDSRLLQLRAVEAEEVEAESWNVDALQQLIDYTEKLGRIPFQDANDLYDLAPSGRIDQVEGAESGPDNIHDMADLRQSSASVSKGKGKEQDVVNDPHMKRTIFNLYPKDAEHSWWSTPGDNRGELSTNENHYP